MGSNKSDRRRHLLAMDRVHEADDLARQRHEQGRRARAAAEEADAAKQLAVGHAGAAEEDLLARSEVLGLVDSVHVLEAELLEARGLFLVGRLEPRLDLAAQAAH